MFDIKEKTSSNPKIKKSPENNLIVRSLDDPSSRKNAIHAQCFMCLAGTKNSFPDPGWRKRIKECRVPDCYIWQFRPFQKK